MKRLCKSRTDIKLDGVCAGIAKYLDADVTMVRIIFVLLSLFTSFFPGVIVYIACSLIMPREDGVIDMRDDNKDDRAN